MSPPAADPFASHFRETPTHVYFLRGPLSQWHPSRFRAALAPSGPELEFNCAEQYMMAGKATLFQDTATLARIMAVQPGEGSFHHAPMQHRQLGREVTPFVDATWREAAHAIVLRGNHAKFAQNPDLRLALQATGTKTLVEGSSKDRIWGVGIAWNDPAIENQANWKGTNWLGHILMQVRAALHPASFPCPSA
jgi:ribA/ribD-fused uncharacterized protein